MILRILLVIFADQIDIIKRYVTLSKVYLAMEDDL